MTTNQTPEEIKALKGRGWLLNKGTNTFSARIVTVNGKVSSDQLRAVAEAAQKFGTGEVTFTYRQSIDNTISSAEQLSEETSELAAAEDTNMLRAILSRLSETRDSITQKASTVMNRFVESLAVMIVTSCVIPVLVILFFVWLVKMVLNIKISIPPKKPSK